VVDACRFILERWARSADLVVAKVSSDKNEFDAPREYGLEAGDVVTVDQMRVLFAEGCHPLAGTSGPGASGPILALGAPYRPSKEQQPFQAALRDRFTDRNTTLGCQLSGLAGTLHQNGLDILRRVTEVSGGTAYPLYAPMIAPDGPTAVALRRHPGIHATMEH
jgi:hypothetical protein